MLTFDCEMIFAFCFHIQSVNSLVNLVSRKDSQMSNTLIIGAVYCVNKNAHCAICNMIFLDNLAFSFYLQLNDSSIIASILIKLWRTKLSLTANFAKQILGSFGPEWSLKKGVLIFFYSKNIFIFIMYYLFQSRVFNF